MRNPLAALAALVTVLAPASAWARPPGPSHAASVAAALYGGIGGPVCLAASVMVACCVAAFLWTGRRGFRLCAGAGGALTIGLALILAHAGGGHDRLTEIALAAGVIGLAMPALQALFGVGAELES